MQMTIAIDQAAKAAHEKVESAQKALTDAEKDMALAEAKAAEQLKIEEDALEIARVKAEAAERVRLEADEIDKHPLEALKARADAEALIEAAKNERLAAVNQMVSVFEHYEVRQEQMELRQEQIELRQ